jgi:hypothetical protein
MQSFRYFDPARLIACALIIGFLSAASVAQDPLVVAPQAYKLQLENEWVRVIRVHYAPFEKLPVHDHPKRQSIFIYLNDGGPVLFKHVEGISGTYAATRPPTKAGAYRLAGVQPENHIVENLSDVPSDFLQVELKTDPVDIKTFRGRFFAEHGSKQGEGTYRKMEFENEQTRITRLICSASGEGEPLGPAAYPSLLVALSPMQLETRAKDSRSSRMILDLGQTRWLEAGGEARWHGANKTKAEMLLIEFKTKPVASTGGTEKHKH